MSVMGKKKIITMGKPNEKVRLRIPIQLWDAERQMYLPVAGQTVLVQVESERQIAEVKRRIEKALE